jgi:electron transfer flavoprotein alpha subunit
MVKKMTGRRPKGNLVKDLDAAIALLTRVRALAASTPISDGTSRQAAKPTPAGKQSKRVLSADAREAIATAQKKRWAKVRRQKKKAEREALAQQPSALPKSGISDTK